MPSVTGTTRLVATSRAPRPRALALALILTLAGLSACRPESSAGRYSGPYAAQVNAALPKIEKGVGRPFKRLPVVEERTREQVRQFIEEQYREADAIRELRGQEVAYKRLGAIPDTLQLESFMMALLTEQIAGYYDPKTDKLYVVEAGPRDALNLTVTHELVHALQDQYLNLDSLTRLRGDEDRAVAAAALLEGEATLEHISIISPGADLGAIWDRARAAIREQRQAMPLMAAAPVFIQELLVFPYLSGAEFVHRFKRHNPGRAPFDALPVSSEQVLHEDAYFGATRDEPTRVILPARVGRATIYENGLGEFEMRLWLFALLRDQALATRGAAGWDGDRYAVIDTPQGEGLVWVTIWDSHVEAGEFLDVARQAAAKRYGGRAATDASVTAAGRTVRVVPGEIGGRPAVVWTDLPQGASADVLDLAGVTLQQP